VTLRRRNNPPPPLREVGNELNIFTTFGADLSQLGFLVTGTEMEALRAAVVGGEHREIVRKQIRLGLPDSATQPIKQQNTAARLHGITSRVASSPINLPT
jgi:hypothetical protein